MADEQKKLKIFIVEDDADLSDMLTAYFQVQGYQVAFAGRGEEAVQKISDFMPDIAMLDIRLPDIDGYEVCRRLRANRRTQDLPVIFLTEKREQTDKLAGLELGAVDYITKPFDIQELRLRVRNALRRTSRSSMMNPVTGLPEGSAMRERLETAVQGMNWGLVLVQMQGLNAFRDSYGFVAADDVSRAVALMLTNAVQETSHADDFLGHLDTGDYVLVTSASECSKLARRCDMRLQASVPYFYPALERHRIKDMGITDRLNVHVTFLSSNDYEYTDMDSLLRTLVNGA
ncbi:MAG: response regulator [Ardenticatenaceae bacterium]|nr:response regulator [Anaerolineales bacterium]MCB8922635.1 response regulator [Ardenticatenaceae bacterium]MCB9003657.1 response regulator [Ardenticatenaceae bacterium]